MAKGEKPIKEMLAVGKILEVAERHQYGSYREGAQFVPDDKFVNAAADVWCAAEKAIRVELCEEGKEK